ncbi:hypothetical protein Tco_1512995, partial [Tanacetum coccineum]
MAAMVPRVLGLLVSSRTSLAGKL